MARAGLLAPLLVGALSSCGPGPPPISVATDEPKRFSDAESRLANARAPAADVCAIYRSMFPASVISSPDLIHGDPRVSTATEAANETPAQVRALRATLLEASGGAGSPLARIPEDLLVRAFRTWRREPLPDCDWDGFRLEVAAPARKGQIPPVLTDDETGSYTRVSRPFFLDRDTAIVLVREVIDDGRRGERKLVFTHRGDDGWAMIPTTFQRWY